MKSLLIIRHAKSNQSFGGSDFERPLNERGMADAPVMARRMTDRSIAIDTFVSSPARRAKQTAEYFCEVYNTLPQSIQFVSALYHAPAEVFYEVVRQFTPDMNTVALFSHNPGITGFVNGLCEKVQIDNMPTCGIFAVQADIKHWADFTTATRSFWFFEYPKLQQ